MLLKPLETQKIYVYLIRNPFTSEILYVGVDKLQDVFNFTHLRKHSAFDINAMYQIELRSNHDFLVHAKNRQSEILKVECAGKRPPLNRLEIENRFKQIKDDDSGQIFNSQQEICKIMGLNQGQLSKHLARAPDIRPLKAIDSAMYKTHNRVAELTFNNPVIFRHNQNIRSTNNKESRDNANTFYSVRF